MLTCNYYYHTCPTRRRDCFVRRIASQQHGEHKCWRSRATTAAESTGPRSTHVEHPGAQDAGQGARREHHQRPADGLKVNRRTVEGARRCEPHRPHARSSVTRKREHWPFARASLRRTVRAASGGAVCRPTRARESSYR